jgi:hypothetical protein
MLPSIALLAQYAATLDVLDMTRVSVRATQPAPVVAGQAPIVGVDLATAPTARFVLASRTLEFTASYSPTLTLPDIEVGLAPILIHGGLVSTLWHDRRFRLSLSEAGTYGQLNSALLYQPVTAPGQPPVVEAAPVAQTIEYGSSTSDGSLAYVVDRRTTLTALGGYSYRGGLNAAAQGVVPLQTIARGGASVANLLSRQDLATTQVNALEVDTNGQCPPPVGNVAAPAATTGSCREEAQIVELQEVIAHRLSSATLFSVGGGVALVSSQAPSLQETEYVPTALVSLASQAGLSRFSLLAQLAPLPDMRTGLVTDRLQSTATWTEALAARSSMTVTAGALRSVSFLSGDDPYPLTVLSGEVVVVSRLDQTFDLALGLRAFWQEQTGYGNFGSEISYVSVTARLPTVHF